tara:strand:- start:505 stop:783 length:279 start_codon:yes stop_codon:yes gene_type:complete
MKKILITVGVLMTMSFAPEQECYRAQCEDYVYNYEVDRIISDVEDFMEWNNEDLYQGIIDENTHQRRTEHLQEILDDLLKLERTIIHLAKRF